MSSSTELTLPGFTSPVGEPLTITTSHADPSGIAAISPFFRASEAARTMAWRALEDGDMVRAELYCREAAAAFERAADEIISIRGDK